MDFESSMKRLAEISEKMSSGELPLEEAMKLYAEATVTVKQCKDYLNNAKLTIEQLEAQEIQNG